MKEAVAGIGTDDWGDQYRALDSARRLCRFHKDVLLKNKHNLKTVVKLVATALRDVKSTMVRNALYGVNDMFRWVGGVVNDGGVMKQALYGTIYKNMHISKRESTTHTMLVNVLN